VDPDALDALVQAELHRPVGEIDAFLLDEIGKMELLCPSFVEVVPRLLDSPIPVIATVALTGSLHASVLPRQRKLLF
jgi:nucleoside-triphosphatase THEP1